MPILTAQHVVRASPRLFTATVRHVALESRDTLLLADRVCSGEGGGVGGRAVLRWVCVLVGDDRAVGGGRASVGRIVLW